MTTIIQDDNQEEEEKQYQRKKLYDLSLKSLEKILQLEDPDEEWVSRRTRGSVRSWEVWDQK